MLNNSVTLMLYNDHLCDFHKQQTFQLFHSHLCCVAKQCNENKSTLVINVHTSTVKKNNEFGTLYIVNCL